MFKSISDAAPRHDVHWRYALLLSAACLLVCGLISCSDDDNDSGTTPTATSEQQVQEGLTGLATFGASALNSPAVNVMSQPHVSGLMAGLGIELPDLPVLGGIGTASSKMLTKELVEGMVPRPVGLASAADIDNFYGTYTRDLNNSTEPFPGWVLTTPDVPPDGLIFQFPADPNDIVMVDPNTGAVTPLAGELRFLGINTDFDPEVENSEITSMTFELALGLSPTELEIVARVTYQVTYLLGNPTVVRIGDQNNLADSFIGTMSFAIWMDVIVGIQYPDADLGMQMVDTSTTPHYAIRIEADIQNYNPNTELPEAATIVFSFGETSTPTTPPFVFSVAVTDITENQQEELEANLSGSVVVSGTTLATFSGSLDDVAVNADLNGDGAINELDVCIDINITFNTGESGNICVVFIELAGSIPTDMLGSMFAGPFCPCAR